MADMKCAACIEGHHEDCELWAFADGECDCPCDPGNPDGDEE